MVQTLRYGADSTFEIDLPDHVLLADCSSVTARPIDDAAAAVAAALADPLNFPPLSRATVLGDRIVLVLEPGLPQVAQLVAGVVHTLLESGSEPDDITIVRTITDTRHPTIDPTSLLADEVRSAVHVVTHDPADLNCLAYLATSKSGRPIYVNRAICDADVVLPLGVFRLDPDCEPASLHANLFCVFSDEETVQRVGRFDWSGGRAERHRRCEEADEAGWLLGVQFTIQVIPGRGDCVLEIVAGEVEAVAAYGRTLCETAWRFEVPRRASLVVATIEGGEDQQTWGNFARALVVASKAVAVDGSIVICSELRREPCPAINRSDATNDGNRVSPSKRYGWMDESAPSTALAEARQRARVYLLSGLDGATVEDLGLGYVAATDEIARLSKQHDSCILVSSAQNAVVVAQCE